MYYIIHSKDNFLILSPILLSFVINAPPRAQEIILSEPKLNIPIWPNVPTSWPLYFTPNEWAQSSIIFILCLAAIAKRRSKFAGSPKVCWIIKTLVLGVMRFSKSAGSILKVLLISIKIGLAPVNLMAFTTTTQV